MLPPGKQRVKEWMWKLGGERATASKLVCSLPTCTLLAASKWDQGCPKKLQFTALPWFVILMQNWIAGSQSSYSPLTDPSAHLVGTWVPTITALQEQWDWVNHLWQMNQSFGPRLIKNINTHPTMVYGDASGPVFWMLKYLLIWVT